MNLSGGPMRLSVNCSIGAAVALTALGCGWGWGCTEATGPLADPSILGADLALIDTVFAAPVVRSAGLFLYGAPLPSPPPGGPLIPDSLLGKTLAWSCAASGYAVTADTGAPVTAV